MIDVRCSMTFLVIWCHWHWYQHHVMQTTLLMVPLHSLGQDDQNEVQHDVLDHVTALAQASTSNYANGIVNGTITFLISKWSKWCAKSPIWSCNSSISVKVQDGMISLWCMVSICVVLCLFLDNSDSPSIVEQ